MSRFWAAGRELGSFHTIGEDGREGALSLSGLISSRLGRVGEPIRLMELGSGIFFHFVDDAEVMIGAGLCGRGLPVLATGVCCVDAG